MFLVFAALISSSLAFAQSSTKIPVFAGFSGCIEQPKTFTIQTQGSSFQKISFITSKDEFGKSVPTVKIESAPPNEPLTLPCNFFEKRAAQSQHWSVTEEEEGASLEDFMLDFSNKNKLGTYILTNKNENIIHTKVIVHQLGEIELHDDSWPVNTSIHLFCGFDSSINAKSARVDIDTGSSLTARYETLKFLNMADDPSSPPAKGPCPTENYTVDLRTKTFTRILDASSTSTPAAAKASMTKKASGAK